MENHVCEYICFGGVPVDNTKTLNSAGSSSFEVLFYMLLMSNHFLKIGPTVLYDDQKWVIENTNSKINLVLLGV